LAFALAFALWVCVGSCEEDEGNVALGSSEEEGKEEGRVG
jgi:hypothetical protein